MTTRSFRSTATTPVERGREFGLAHAAQIAATVDAYRRIFATRAGAPVDLAHWGGLALDRIAAVSTALAEEVAGIADGADLPVTSIAAINARTEILAAVGASGAHECSTVVHVGEGSPVAVQAWDWYAALSDSWLVWEIPHADGHVTTTLTEYGILGKIGVSTRGLGLLFNILHHDQDGAGIGDPVHVLARAVLDEATDLNHALLKLSTAAVSASSSLTVIAVADGESAAISVECNPGGVGYALPDDNGLLLHTNHFLSNPAALHDDELRTGPDTVVRYDTLRRRLAGRTTPSIAQVLTAMNSHLLGGGALCCHADSTLPSTGQFETLATVALDVEAGTLTAHAGGPCTHPLNTTPPLETRMLNLKRIDNMDILTKDVQALVDFYHGTLGLPFHLPYEPDEEWAAIDFGNLTLYIFKSEVGEHAPRRTAVNPDNAPGLDSFAFEVDDLDESEAYLDGKVEWVDQRIEWKHPSGTWYRYRPFFDPDGNMLYITEPHPTDA
ncbi:acyltransferase [Mycobacterium yunnanensis]|uniref:Acyltransferase n=1 Tax=Mycobacterium yunnanensis TaxID=368477 RepID=A0A9X3C2C9_9MYCO|nr:C45 family autoproteolytic acyltransferase/hydolase [Mycobacterium yunnanensis]MCV7422468.1 acyltransferase [Mycobacterium yunnanensis]